MRRVHFFAEAVCGRACAQLARDTSAHASLYQSSSTNGPRHITRVLSHGPTSPARASPLSGLHKVQRTSSGATHTQNPPNAKNRWHPLVWHTCAGTHTPKKKTYILSSRLVAHPCASRQEDGRKATHSEWLSEKKNTAEPHRRRTAHQTHRERRTIERAQQHGKRNKGRTVPTTPRRLT